MNNIKYLSGFLYLLTGLFAFFVAAQLLAAIGISFLSVFDYVSIDTLSYEIQLLLQVIILGLMIQKTRSFSSGRFAPKKTKGLILLLLGLMYFLAIVTGLILGLTRLSGHLWFTHFTPMLFHFVLASYLLLLGYINVYNEKSHRDKTYRTGIVPWLVYPAVISYGLLLHVALIYHLGVPIIAGTYMSIISVALIVIVFERVMPHRLSWHPLSTDIKNDAVYMVLIQLMLPKLVGIGFLLWIVTPIQTLDLSLSQWWPHHWSVASQAILMLLSADFFRYWLHRLAHTNKILWRLHAVHHSPRKLYWLNVTRFHPLEKPLQMVFDVLPFLFLDVNENVIAAYFVFYSMNGFFQHANIHLKFGWLNKVISTSELHRWHHSKLPSESNTNYGNNFIIWDLIFGSYFLPQNKRVNELGLKYAFYPDTFFGQIKAPFISRRKDK